MTARLQRWQVNVQGKRGLRSTCERPARPLTWAQAARFVDAARDELHHQGWQVTGVHLVPEQGE